jgi:hypothetical protein
MQNIIEYLIHYYKHADKWLLLFCLLFTTSLIVLNYTLGIETKWLYKMPNGWKRLLGFYILYATAFIVPYIALSLRQLGILKISPSFIMLLLIAPAIFALKVNYNGFTNWISKALKSPMGSYYSTIAQLPIKLLWVSLLLYILHSKYCSTTSFWGLTTANVNYQPYLLMLLIMIPLIAIAATQKDFLTMYPKYKTVVPLTSNVNYIGWYNLLYELSYGTDFIGIELFFRGFLVFAFVRFVGADAILPMAVFYCTIHFGKPLLECISSFFGGCLLGIIAYKTQSIAGGIMVHLGIAWMMEVAGSIGNKIKVI